MMSDFLSICYKRRSIRKFTDQPVEVKKVEAILKAALLAPSGKAVYPCEFIVVDDPNVLEAVSKAKSTGAALLAKAPLAIVVVADTSKTDVWVEDASIVSAFMLIEAENQGLGCCWIQMHLRGTTDGKSSTDNMRELLNLGKNHQVLSVLAIGYKAEEKQPRSDDDLLLDKVHHLRLK
jgi:nitroreductase